MCWISINLNKSMESDPLPKDYFARVSSQFKDKIILEVPSRQRSHTKARKKFLIFFITGNPALPEYYNGFLHSLQSLLAPRASQDVEINICSQSLPGFEIAEHSNPYRSLHSKRPNGLLYQIQATFDALQNAILQCSSNNDDTEPPAVILVGHSVGAYIALELIRGERLDTLLEAQSLHTNQGGLNIVAAICLLPTVVDIAKSRNGQIFTPLSHIPFFPEIIAVAAKVLTSLVPQNWLFALVKMVTSMPAYAAAVTTAFLGSKMGVRAALTMARDEMRIITADKWDHRVWGAANRARTGRRHRLFFYFGQEDHWVSERTRDDLIKARVRNGDGEQWKPVMEIDRFGVPHGFCVKKRDWIVVAEKVKEYVESVIKAELDSGRQF